MTFPAGAFRQPEKEVSKNHFQTPAAYRKYHTFDSGHDSCAVGVDGGFARPPARGPDTPARCGRSPDVQGATKATRTSKKRKRKRFAGRRKCVICCCNGGRKANDNEKIEGMQAQRVGTCFFRTAAGASRRNATRHARYCVPSVPRGWGILR